MTYRFAALIKQIPAFEEMSLGPDGRLQRDGLDLEMNPYCRRAVAQAVQLAIESGGSVTVFTLGPPSAEDVLREAIAWGIERGVEMRGVLVSDPRFAGSDTLATATALAAAITREGPFDLILAGRNSVDADTGQVGPELAELLDLPFATGVRHLALTDGILDLRCEHDDGWVQARVALPAVISTAERLIDPCKVDPPGRAAVPADRLHPLTADALGPGPWGATASPTSVGAVRVHDTPRTRIAHPDLSVAEQVERALAILTERGAFDPEPALAANVAVVGPPSSNATRVVAVVVEPMREVLTRELLGVAGTLDARAVAITTEEPDPHALGGWGADEIVWLRDPTVEEDVAAGITAWAREHTPWAVLAPGTAWGREVASRTAAALSAGLTGDAVGLERDGHELVAWKPAFGGRLVAAIRASSPVQLATVRAGVLPRPAPRAHQPSVTERAVAPRGRVDVLARTRDDDLDVLADAHTVIGVGQGVDPSDYPALDPLLAALGAELGATRKVTDQGWLPRARQIGITGRSIAPRLFISLGASGKFNHMVGVRGATTVLAINTSPDALVFDAADVGIVGDWREVVPLLVESLRPVPARPS